jgi:hypothetical protein
MRLVAALVLATTPASAAVVSDMTPDRIREAIAYGTREKHVRPVNIGNALLSWGGITTPFLRVAMAANEAKRTYKPFGEADVTPEMIAPEVHVYVPPHTKDRRAPVISPEAVIVWASGAPVQPARVEDMPAVYQNAFGATHEGRSIYAVFPLSVLGAENEVRIVYERHIKEQRWKFPMAKLR